MVDTFCPYCKKEVEICHDDGFGTAEDALHHMECPHCRKIFVFTTAIIFCHISHKADCLNGGKHTMEKVWNMPKIYPDWIRCADCGYEEKGEFDKTALDQ
jgi:DNA-directed RNA polymerase subunit RPC12/RpoP